MTDDVDLVVNSSYSSSNYPCSDQTGTVDEACSYTTNYAGSMTIEVRGDKSLYGARYTLGLTSGLENQGTLATPVELTASEALSYNGEVSRGYSFYKVSGLVPNTRYSVSLGNITANADIRTYDSSDFTISNRTCESINSGTTPEWYGATSNTAGEIYVKVDGTKTSTGAAFTPGVDLAPVSEGAIGAEVTLAHGTTDLPYSGSVGITKSYYAVTNLSSNTTYTIALSNTQGGEITLYGYNTTPISPFMICHDTVQGGVSATCTLTTGNGGALTVYIEVDGTQSKGGATYTLDVAP